MALILDGTTGIVANNIADYAISTAKLANSSITVPKMGYTGAILQAVTAEDATTYTSSSSSTTTTIVSASITPSSTSSRILILAQTGEPDIADGRGYARVFRNNTSTPIFTICTEFGRGINNVSESHYGPLFGQYIDSPATTSSTTYFIGIQIQLGSGSFRVGNGSKQRITLLEIS